MKRLSSIRPVVMAIIAVLFASAGTVALESPAQAVTVPATDLRPRAVYFELVGDKAQRQWVLDSMTAANALQGRVWTDFFASWDRANSSLKIRTSIPADLPPQGHVFVVLGSALTKSGGITAKLERRLKIALAALAKYPKSKVLVTGGAPRKGKTEAAVMYSWLRARGIARARILVEAQASSTIGNATKSMAILNRTPDVTSYTLISDASHIRRASVLFSAAATRIQEESGTAWEITPASHVAYMDRTVPLPNPPTAATHAIIASNVASVFGVLAPYRALIASPPAAPALTAIEVTAPTKVEYAVGEDLDAGGLVVKASYNDGAYARLVTGEALISGFASSTVGAAEATVTYAERGATTSASFPYSIVKAPTHVGLRLSSRQLKRSLTRVAVTAKVTSSAAAPLPTGKVRFYLDGTWLRTITLTPAHNGVAKFTFPTIGTVGQHRIVVKYVGSAQLRPARATVDVTVT